MAQSMTENEVRTFMGTGSKTGKVATVRADGSPHVAAVWFGFDDDGTIIFVSQVGSVKVRNIQRDPRVSVFVDDETMPFAFARADGIVESLSSDPDDLLYWATETCRRYVGDDRADEFGRRNAAPGEVVVRVRPLRLIGMTGMAD